MSKKRVKKQHREKHFYLQVLKEFEKDTNLSRIRKKLNLNKQELNYYCQKLVNLNFLYPYGNGWYEVTEKGKNPTQYGITLSEDMSRGHAYVWTIQIEKIPDTWSERISILEKHKTNYILVGAMKNIPRIMILGRKVWLCNKHIRIFDKEKASYYGNTAKDSKELGYIQAFKILRVLENKLGIKFNPNKIKFVKEHYALIKNSLAIHHNEKNILLRVKDENGEEWLLIDDSKGDGGELETVGKDAFETHPLVQDWWNSNKKHNFEITADYVLNNLNSLTDSQKMTQQQLNELMLVAKTLLIEVEKLKREK